MICNVFKQRRRINGVIVEASNWSGRLRMQWEATVSTIPLHTPDKRLALHKLLQVADEREKEKNGLLPPKPIRDAAARPLPELLGEYLVELESRNRTPRTLKKYRTIMLKLFERCRWQRIQDATGRSFCLWRNHCGLSGKTSNDLLACAATFFDWLERQRMVTENPLKYVERVDTRGRSQYRRALTQDEVRQLLDVCPPSRAVVYLTALYTGLRRRELDHLRWGDLDLDGPKPSFRTPASIAKNKKETNLPLRLEVVSALRSIRPPDAAPFQWVFHHQVPRVRTLQKDLVAAGISFVDDTGRRMDFHGLRVTFCTMLALSGVPLNEAMQLMRHSDPRLTMKIYLDTSQMALSPALALLPSIHLPRIAANL